MPRILTRRDFWHRMGKHIDDLRKDENGFYIVSNATKTDKSFAIIMPKTLAALFRDAGFIEYGDIIENMIKELEVKHRNYMSKKAKK